MITPNQATGEIRPKSAQALGETRLNPIDTLASLLVMQGGMTDKLSNLVETIYLIAQFQPEDHTSIRGALNLCSRYLLEIYGTSLSVEGGIRRLVEGGCDEHETH